MLHSIIIICSHNRHQAHKKKPEEEFKESHSFATILTKNFSNKERQKKTLNMNCQHNAFTPLIQTRCAHTIAAQYRIFLLLIEKNDIMKKITLWMCLARIKSVIKSLNSRVNCLHSMRATL